MAKKSDQPSSIAQNKKARFDYFIEERVEAGLALQGWEVKSMRAGKAQLVDAYVILREGDHYVAWIDERKLHVGDKIDEFTVTAIDPDDGVHIERNESP